MTRAARGGLIAATGILLAAGAVWFGARRWDTGTHQLRTRLLQASRPDVPARFDIAQLDGLPAPVQRYFRTVLQEGQPYVTRARMRHRGTFNMGEGTERWTSFTSDQLVVTNRPGFDWDGRIAMLPGVTVRVHDAYVAGEGRLYASVMGLVTVADLRGTPEMNEGELLRFFAEATWYPTALLPSQNVQWTAIDGRSARATLVDDAASVTMTFTFTDEGLIDAVRADARGRTVGDQVVPTPWQGRFWNYRRVDGMLIPFDGEVEWLLAEGPWPYWRGHIETVAYEFSR